MTCEQTCETTIPVWSEWLGQYIEDGRNKIAIDNTFESIHMSLIPFFLYVEA